jgi:hypothetical protein
VARLLLQADAGDDEVEYEDATSSDDEEMVEVRAALESVVRQLGEANGFTDACLMRRRARH